MQLTPAEGKYLTYAIYAKRFGWTPQQVDAMPLEVEQWMLPILSVIDEVEEKRREEQRAH